MQINNNTVVSLTYELRENDSLGEILEKVSSRHPMDVLVGHHQLLAGFENNLMGKKMGDSFEFSLTCDEAYGQPVDENLIQVPKNAFEVNGSIDEKLLEVGTIIPMVDEHGRKLQGKVSEVNGEIVVMDFNHSLAGKDLHFRGTIEHVREATEQELQHGHAHHECSCGGGCDC